MGRWSYLLSSSRFPPGAEAKSSNQLLPAAMNFLAGAPKQRVHREDKPSTAMFAGIMRPRLVFWPPSLPSVSPLVSWNGNIQRRVPERRDQNPGPARLDREIRAEVLHLPCKATWLRHGQPGITTGMGMEVLYSLFAKFIEFGSNSFLGDWLTVTKKVVGFLEVINSLSSPFAGGIGTACHDRNLIEIPRVSQLPCAFPRV